MISPGSFKGIFTPLVTPLTEGEQLDTDSLCRLVEFQIRQGVHGLWVMGTTGEFPAFDEEERAEAVEATVSQAGGRVPVVANISDAATRLVFRHLKRAEKAGADAVAVTPPYYYPNSQTELLAHYRAVAAETSLPIFIYNIPQTVGVAVSLGTAITLAEEGSAGGIKDSQNNLEWFRELTLRLGRTRPDFRAFAGTRHLIDASLLAGACGAIPSLANAHPDLCVKTYEAGASGDFAAAGVWQSQIVEIESMIEVGRGSRNAAVIGGLKARLMAQGIITTAKLTEPLLPP